MSAWTTSVDITAKVRRRWDDGSLLRSYAERAPFDPIEIPIRGPRASQIGDDLGAVRDWIGDLVEGSRSGTRYALDWAPVGGRAIGRNEIPVRATLYSYAQAWLLLKVQPTVQRFDAVLEQASLRAEIRGWVARKPHRALELSDVVPRLCATVAWIDAHRGSGAYLREISAPGVDTKFAERHRGDLADIFGVPGSSSSFLEALGLRAKPSLVRLRPSPALGLPLLLTEIAVRSDELARLDIRPTSVLVIENEITYLSADVPFDGLVIWGKGFAVGQLRGVPWLAEANIHYWGDIDTHGFAILNRLRSTFPQVQSVLMDRATLMEHLDRWSVEERPARATLRHLTDPERSLYDDLVGDAIDTGVRLEQERIDWTWARRHLPV